MVTARVGARYAGGLGSWRTVRLRQPDSLTLMVAQKGIAVARHDGCGNACRQQRHAGGNIAMMMVSTGMSGMLVGMMVAVVQRNIAEQHMLMIAGRAGHMLDIVDHGGGTGAGEDERQRNAQQRAEFSERQQIHCLHRR